MHMMEEEFINKHENNNNMVVYSSYVDDCFVILKRSANNILDDIHKFDENIRLTVERTGKNQLIFLDSKVYIKNGQLEMQMHHKKSSS